MPVGNNGLISPAKQVHHKPSSFAEIAPKISSEQIVARISTEIKRINQHRRRNNFSMSPPPAMSMHKKELSDTHSSLTSGFGCSPAPSTCRDTPVLSLRQVGLVCERMMQEREDQLREEYDKVLNDKLNEQYEAFLKFNHDQLHRKFGETAASYVS